MALIAAVRPQKCSSCDDEHSSEKVVQELAEDGRLAKFAICPACRARHLVEYLEPASGEVERMGR